MAGIIKESTFSKLARIGYASKGVIYFSLGILALMTGLTKRNMAPDSSSALLMIFQQPFGQIMIGVLLIGIVSYILWRLGQFFLDLNHKGSSKKGWASRFRYFLSAIAYSFVGISALKLLLHRQSSSGEKSTRAWTARLMEQPFGEVLVIVVGASFIAAGIWQGYLAYSRKYEKDLNFSSLKSSVKKLLSYLCSFGFYARGLVFAIMGIFFIIAAINSRPSASRGLGGSLEVLRNQAYGPYLLALVAMGLSAYGIYCFIQCCYRKQSV